MRLTKEAEQLLLALRADTCGPAHKMLLTNRGSTARMQELIQAWPNTAKDDLCQAILRQVQQALAGFHAEVEADNLSDTECQQEQAEELLVSLVGLIRVVVEEGQGPISTALQEAAHHLHDQGILMADGAAELQDAVVKLCSLWWQKELPGRADMVPQMIPYLLFQATVSGRAADVKRCYSLRGALALLDFDDPSIQGVQALMVRAAMLPPFLRCADGRKFIAHLFTLHPKMVYELTAVILNQIVSGRKSVLDAYGEIIFKAWRAASGACLERIETHLIQNSLIRSALRASSTSLAASLRRVLEGLHSQKLTPGTDAMLLRLYHPLLFRDLAAANAAVRNNALQLLIDAFPLQDTGAPAEESDELLQRQFEELSKGLQDEAPAVRITAAFGICTLLNTYWELVPPGTTAAYLKRLTDEVAYDAASPGVRLAAVQGLTGLIDNPLAQPLLKVVLPKLGPLLHDRALKVRVGLADLLLTVMRVRQLHFVDMVGVEQLLEVMAQDEPPVAERIQRLLLPSYLPDGVEGLARVAMLLRQNPTAGRTFCAYLSQAVPVERVADLIVALRDHLLSSAPALGKARAAAEAGPSKGGKGRKGRKQTKAVVTSHEEAEEERAEEVQHETSEAWQSLLGGMTELCMGMATAVAAGQGEDTALQGLFPADALVQLLGLCQTATGRGSVMHIAAALTDAPAAAAVQTRCLEQLLDDDGQSSSMSNSELRAVLQCVLAGSAKAALTTALKSALETGLGPARPVRPAAGMSLTLALRCLDLGLQDKSIRGTFLSEGLLASALPLLQPSSVGGPAEALIAAIVALPEANHEGRAVQASLASTALVLHNRVALHLHLAADHTLAPKPHLPGTAALADQAEASGSFESISIRQSDAEPDLLAHQGDSRHDNPAAAASATGGSAAAVEAAVLASCEVAGQVLQQLQALEASTVTGLMGAAEEVEPRRKKGRSAAAVQPSNCPSQRLSCLGCIQAGHTFVLGALAVAGDAARLLQWGHSLGAAVATSALAGAMLAWADQLCKVSSETAVTQLRDSALLSAMSLVGGSAQQALPQANQVTRAAQAAESACQAVTQQYQPADSAAAMSASSMSDSGSCHDLEALGEAVMQQGCCSEVTSLMKPFLPGFLTGLSDPHSASRWLLPLVSLIGNTMAADMGSGGSPGAEHGSCRGAQEPDMSPSLRAADHSQLPTQLNDQPQPDDADSHQGGGKENMSVNQAAPNRGQGKGRKGAKAAPASEAESRTIDHSFVLAVLAAVKAAQVHEQVAGMAAALAVQCWQERQATSSLGAVQLTRMLGYAAPDSARHRPGGAGAFERCAALLAHLHCALQHSAAAAGCGVVLALQKLVKQLQRQPLSTQVHAAGHNGLPAWLCTVT